MADLRISDLVTAAQLKDNDYIELSQAEGGTRVSYKATMLAIAVLLNKIVQYTSDLNTTDKTIIGAINELKQLIALIPGFNIVKVNVLPTEDIDQHTLYLVPSANPETQNSCDEYINTTGTSAGWEIVGSTNIDLSDYYTKLQADGKFAVTITNTISPTTTTKKVADIKQNNVTTPVYADDADKVLRAAFGEHTVEGNPVSVDAFLGLEVPSEAEVSFSTIQDLHGQSAPYVGGAGKNKAPLTLANIKALNTYGQWNENVYAYNGIDYTVNLDEAGNVVSIKANGTESSNSSLYFVATGTSTLADYLTNGTNYILSGCTGGSSTAYSVQAQVNGSWYPNYGGDTQFTYTSGGTDRLRIYIPSGSLVTNLMFYPMVRLATESDTTFSPYSNICPISGRTEVDVQRNGVNQWDEEWETGSINANTGETTPDNTSVRSKNYIRVKPNTSYYALPNVQVFGYTANKTFISITSASVIGGVFTTQNNCYYVKFRTPNTYGGTYNNNLGINYPSTDTAYHAYQGATYTSTFGQTVYGGKDEFVSGKLYKEWEYIASYNGETLPSEWISDRDVYAPGTTPTTGAEVCYKLATPTEITLTPQDIELLKGQNVLWTDGDNIKLVYSADIKAYIDSKLA